MRRRRRRSADLSQRAVIVLAGLGGTALVGAFFFFLNAADQATPVREATRIELPDAFKAAPPTATP